MSASVQKVLRVQNLLANRSSSSEGRATHRTRLLRFFLMTRMKRRGYSDLDIILMDLGLKPQVYVGLKF